MSFRRTGKLLTLVGFVICLSLLGILYGNLSTITEERDHILVKKNEIKQEVAVLNDKISSLQEKITRLESSINQCNAGKLEAEEGKSLLQQEADSLKRDLDEVKSSQDNQKTASDQEIKVLQDKLRDAQLEVSGHNEAVETCNSRNEDLLAQISAGNERISQLEKSNQECDAEKRRLIAEGGESNKVAVEVPKNDIAEGGEGEKVNPVAAVPVPAADNEHKEPPADLVDHVADIPEAPQDNAAVDANQAIPNAQAPAPGAQPEPAAAPAGDIGGAVGAAPAPVQPAPVQPAPVQDFKRDAEEQPQEGMGGFQPLQPIPDGALAESLEKVRQEEQLQQLQDRQDQLQPQPPQDILDPVNNDLNPQPDINPQPALPAEIQPAQPAPQGLENDNAVAMETNDVDPDNQNDNEVNNEVNNESIDNDDVIDNEVRLGILPELVPAQPAPA